MACVMSANSCKIDKGLSLWNSIVAGSASFFIFPPHTPGFFIWPMEKSGVL
jgi:hypothetical protein